MRKIAGLALLLTLTASTSIARVEHQTGYSKQQAFYSAVRFLRVEKGFRLVEKDPESGYLLFDYPNGGKEPVTGCVEVIEKSPGVAIVVRLASLPEYHERLLSRGLLAKLRADYGDPAEPVVPEAPSKDKEKDKDEPNSPDDGKEPKEQKPTGTPERP